MRMRADATEAPARRTFLAGSVAAGAALLIGTLPTSAQEKSMQKTFAILYTNDMQSAFVGMGPASDYTPFTLGDASGMRFRYDKSRPMFDVVTAIACAGSTPPGGLGCPPGRTREGALPRPSGPRSNS